MTSPDKKEQENSLDVFYKGTNPTNYEGSALKTYSPSEASLPNTIMFGG